MLSEFVFEWGHSNPIIFPGGIEKSSGNVMLDGPQSHCISSAILQLSRCYLTAVLDPCLPGSLSPLYGANPEHPCPGMAPEVLLVVGTRHNITFCYDRLNALSLVSPSRMRS